MHIEGVCFKQILSSYEARIALEDGRSHVAADKVVGRIPQASCQKKDAKGLRIAHDTSTCQHACRKEQAVARQKGCYHKPCFAKDNDKEDEIDPCAILGDQLQKMIVHMQHKIDKELYEFHK